jgi:hypothetical protein
MPRYVILEHDWPTPHWDVLFEAGTVLRAWRVAAEPRCGIPLPAERNFDHRLMYLDYEGPLTGNRGRVTRWDVGTFDWIEDGGGCVVVEVCGDRLQGRLELTPDSLEACPTASARGAAESTRPASPENDPGTTGRPR